MRVSGTGWILFVLLCGGSSIGAATRHWQTGTWITMGTKLTPWVGNSAMGTYRFGPIPNPDVSPMTEVATYVIETNDMRFELQGMEPIGAFDLEVKVGNQVTFAFDGKRTVFVRRSDGGEHPLLVTKKARKK
jgi:hypothetical protein